MSPLKRLLPAALRFLIPVLILGAGFLLARGMIAGREQPERFTPPPPVVAVEAIRLMPTDFPVVLETDGTVEARTRTTLVPEVAGQIVEVASTFREGAFFEAGDLLVRIDARNYELAVTQAEAEVAQAESALQLELAEAEVVADDYRALGREAPPLGLREPQIAAARANLAAAKARLERARVDLARTVIRAPYAGRVLERQADIGQYVTAGAAIATLYSVETAEVRLPLPSRELAYLSLPGRFRGDDPAPAQAPAVRLTATIGPDEHTWTGRVVRSEGAIDAQSRRLFVIAEVQDPYARRDDGAPPLRVGQFVQAQIEGRHLRDVFVLPRTALRNDDEVLVITSESTLERRPVHVAWRAGDDVIVDRGLAAGEIVNVTPLAVVADGTPVRATVDGEPAPVPARAGRGGEGERRGRRAPADRDDAPAPPARERTGTRGVQR